MIDHSARAAQAARLLDDPLLVEVLDGIEQAAIKQWGATKPDDVEGREWAWNMLKASQRVRGALEGIIDDGKVEASRAVRR